MEARQTDTCTGRMPIRIDVIPNQCGTGVVLLRKTWYEGRRARRKTVANLSDLDSAVVDDPRKAFAIRRSPPCRPMALLGDADGPHWCLAFDAITAFRVRDLSLIAREKPEHLARRHVSMDDVKALQVLAAHYRIKVPRPPPETAIADFAALAGGLAGFHPSRRQPPPGIEKLWQGIAFPSNAVVGMRALDEWRGKRGYRCVELMGWRSPCTGFCRGSMERGSFRPLQAIGPRDRFRNASATAASRLRLEINWSHCPGAGRTVVRALQPDRAGRNQSHSQHSQPDHQLRRRLRPYRVQPDRKRQEKPRKTLVRASRIP